MGSCLKPPKVAAAKIKPHLGEQPNFFRKVASESHIVGTPLSEDSSDKYLESAFIIQHESHSQDLIEYLHDYSNYQEFNHYLTTHFAQENLSFIALIVVFRNSYLSSLAPEEIETFNDLPTTEFFDKLYNLKFKYLHSLNNEIETYIEANDVERILYNIRDKFIKRSAQTSINISCQTRRELINYFNKLGHSKCTQWEPEVKFVCLNLFNQAISEIDGVLNTHYTAYCHQC